MSRFAGRIFALVLIVVCESATLHVASAATSRKSGTSVSARKSGTSVSARKRGTAARSRARRARRPPPGGVYSRCAVVVDPISGRVLYEKNADRASPIASITKLMTALVFLDQKPDLERSVEVTREEIYKGGHTQLRNHERVTLGDLLHMSLMCSDNVATRVLVRESGIALYEFLQAMNERASQMGLADTRFVECTGLDQGNVASATDVARLLQAAAKNELIHSITTTTSYDFRSDTRPHRVANTNRLLHGRYQVLGGKTGFISQAGYCFATWIRTDGRDLIAVVLGAPTNATRFADVVRLIQRTMTAGLTPAKS